MALSEEQRVIVEQIAEVLENSEEFDNVDQHGVAIHVSQDGIECTLRPTFGIEEADDDGEDVADEIIGTEE